MDTLTLFPKNLNQRSMTPRWPLTPCLLRSHVWLYPRIIVSKSHDNTSMYVDTVINFAKYHIHTHTTYRMSDHIVSYWTQFRRDKNSVQARQKCDALWQRPRDYSSIGFSDETWYCNCTIMINLSSVTKCCAFWINYPTNYKISGLFIIFTGGSPVATQQNSERIWAN